MEQQNAKIRELHRIAVDSSNFKLPFQNIFTKGKPSDGNCEGRKVLRLTFKRVSLNRETSGKISARLSTSATTTTSRQGVFLSEFFYHY